MSTGHSTPVGGRPPAQAIGDAATVRAVGQPDEQGLYRWRLEWYPEGHGGKMKTLALGRLAPTAALVAGAGAVGRGLPQEARPGSQQARTVGDLLDFWLGAQEDRRDLAARTVKHREGSAKRLTAALGTLPLEALSQRTIDRYRDTATTTRLPARPLAPRTVQVDLLALLDAVGWGLDRGLPLPARLKMPAIRQRKVYRSRTPRAAEVAAVLAQLRVPWHRALLMLLWATGARIGELRGLCWADVDEARGVMTVSGKTGAREIALTARAREALALLRASRPLGAPPAHATDPLWPGALALWPFRRALDSACKRARVEGFTPHALRRLAADELRRRGAPVEEAAAILGHSPAVMLAKYRRPTGEELSATMRRVNLGDGAEPAAEERGGEEEPTPTPPAVH